MLFFFALNDRVLDQLPGWWYFGRSGVIKLLHKFHMQEGLGACKSYEGVSCELTCIATSVVSTSLILPGQVVLTFENGDNTGT